MHPTNGIRRPRRSRGVSLVEALIAMAIMAFGMLAVVGVQATLRMNADIAKQRSEATRLAEQELEQLRSFQEMAAVAGATLGWDEVVTQMGTVAVVAVANTTFTIDRIVNNEVGSAQKSLTIAVSWQDRHDDRQTVVLRNVLAGAAPVLSGLLSVPPTRTAASQRSGRHPTIPPRAKDMGSGESVFKPREGGTVAWTFNNTTGVITRVCIVVAASTSETLDEGSLGVCSATTAQLLSGYVRFNLAGVANRLDDDVSVYKPSGDDHDLAWVINNATGEIVKQCDVGNEDTEDLELGDLDDCAAVVPPQPIGPVNAANDAGRALTAADADDPRWPAMPTTVSLGLTSVDHAAGTTCFTQLLGSMSDAMRQFSVEYFCIVMPNPLGTWSGRSTVSISDWDIGTDRDEVRVCRYTQAANDVTDNTDHPRNYTDVAGNLINQNFLVVNGSKACPTDVAANPAAADFVNTNTRQHQPAP
ncbi:prepilin-type N-terminal cleavage/methylation domain-containing protein [Ideonella sp. A 288]|uniref:type IV pilus modification PilV family protein n=1 Tax=Ideonella sp. A 288 TaxID=1962181 RepID=UPI000B4A6145|nr:prepilin-type N-terminal cleavage/methylation domain-containing protein [Ideonella sp. A 288]